jgi:hypothetical protein
MAETIMGHKMAIRSGEAQEDSSFSEEKEAKRLLSVGQCLRHCPRRGNGMKVFWFFFSKKNKALF